MPTLPDVHMRGTRALQPAATTVSIGTLYFVTGENKCERSNGTVWESYSAVALELEDRIVALEAAVAALQAGG